jgi:hypothetical protein
MPRWQSNGSGCSRPELDCLGCTREFKCCAFQPFVANFLLGAYLADGGNLLPMRAMLQPLGLIPGGEYRAKYLGTAEAERGEEFLCHFYDRQTRRCGNWKHRPGECSTYFCKPGKFDVDHHSRQTFDRETAIAQMALSELGFERGRIAQQIAYLNDPGFHPSTVEFAYLMEIYRRSWEWAKRLNANQVERWTGELTWA